MLLFKKISILILFLFLSLLSNAQSGIIRGTVFDDATGESLPGVTIFAEGTTIGTMTDFDGKFNLNIAPGTYTLRVSFISYETIKIKDLQVKSGEVNLLDNLRLKEAKIELSEVTITAEVLRNSEIAMLTMKQKSAHLMDGISAVNFRKIGDSDAASSMKRVSGVSVEGGKYVFVRGLGDRYTKTILNGVDIPGLDPDRNTLQMDIFPTNVIDNIVVHKSFSADLPADFTGGVIDIETKDFPEVKTGNFSLSLAYNPQMHFNSNYLTYEGGKTDFLGFDDGTRDIPATTDIPLFSEVVGNPDSEKGQRYRQILESFNPTMATMKQNSFMDYSLGASVGNQISGKKITWGYNAAISYKNNTEFYENAQYGRYGMSGNSDINELETREQQSGDFGVNNVLLSGLAGIALKTNKTKIRINFLRLQNGESKAGVFNYQKSNQGTVFEGIQHNLEYSQRSLTNLLVSGNHYLNNWEIEWKISPTFAKIIDPDVRFTRYEIRDGAYSISTESGFPERIWRNLDEENIAGILNITRDFEIFGNKSKLMFGGASTYKQRTYSILNFAINIRNVELFGDPNEIFSPENLWPMGGSSGKGTTYEAPFIPNNPNQFDANNFNSAAFLSWELSPVKNLRAIVGLRGENFVQRYTGQDQLATNVFTNEVVIDQLNFFPTVNLIYNLAEKQNIRVSYAKTIARPSFKELSYAEIFDPISGRTFIGGLFRDANDFAGIEYWDGNLQTTDIQNYDIRWELFGQKAQTISLGVFYKSFSKPIEIVPFVTLVGAFQPRNVGDGEVSGIELELRKNLDFLSTSMKNFTFSSNLTLTQSRIKLSNTEYASRLENARTGQSIDNYRDMAGQAPYIVNGGISYNGGENGFWNGLEAGIYYNVQGQTLEIVGIVDRPDIYSKPFHSLNINANKSFGKDKRMQIGLKIDNLLNAKKESVFVSYEAQDQYFTKLNQGTTFQVRFGYKFF
jgi:TonB-dependent receptor